MKKRVWSIVTMAALIVTSVFLIAGCGAKKNAEFEAMKAGKFYMDCNMTGEELSGLEIPFKMTADGKNVAYSMSFMGMEMAAINKDGKSIEIDKSYKTYTVKENAAEDGSPADMFADVSALTKSTKGKGTIKDQELEYEEFSQDGNKDALRYYYKDKKLFAIDILVDGKSSATMLINEFKAEPMTSMFEIPAGFTESK